MKKKIFRGAMILLAILLIAIGGYLIFHRNATSFALESYKSDEIVKVTDKNGYIYFEPVNSTADKGLIYYPGGKVSSIAYSPTARGLAEKGYAVAIPKVFGYLAFFQIKAADKVIKDHNEIKNWVLTGHSLGGVAASAYLSGLKDKNTKDKIKGIAFIASYPASDISGLGIPAIVILGSQDKLVTEDKIAGHSSKFPKDFQKTIIEGGNHGQFGDYGLQPKDGTATISVEQQTARICEILAEFMKKAFTN